MTAPLRTQRVIDKGSNGQQSIDAKKTGEGAGRHVPSRSRTWTERQSYFGGWGDR